MQDISPNSKQLPALICRTPIVLPYFAVILLSTTAATATKPMRVATFNVQALSGRDSDERFEQVARVIEQSGFPELVALQEIADNDGETDSHDADAGRTLQRLVSHIQQRKGPSYRILSGVPVVNADGGPPGANIRTVMLSTLWTISSTTRVLGAGAPEFDNTRKPLLVQLAFADSTLNVLALHLSAGPTRRDKRLLQAKALASWASAQDSELRHANTVLLGDFNAEESEDVWPILSVAGFSDSTEIPPKPTHASGHAFDRILVAGKGASLGPAQVLPRNSVSDHALVWTDLCLEESRGEAAGGCNWIVSRPPRSWPWSLLVTFALLQKKRRRR
jgi:endonuclease/exonuclease/phosphatase family metal-dependent hydrolase